MAIASGVAYTSVRLFTDVKSGLMARFITMPIKRSSILWAHVLTSLVANVLTIVVVILVALLMGFRSSANILDWLAVAGILGMFTLALTWLAIIPGLKARSMEGATAYSYPLVFFHLLVRPLCLPKRCQNCSCVCRESACNFNRECDSCSLYEGTVGNDIWIALAWCVGIMVISYFFASKAFKRQLG